MSYYINEINKNGNIAVDDTILVKGTPATAGSKMLENFKPLFSAEAVERLEKQGYVISGKTSVGEFGLDLIGETTAFGTAKCAAATLVKNGNVKAALSVDLNGAPRRAAAVMDVTFIKPTYSTVSRYGVIAAACSGEQIGVTAKTAADAREVLTVIAGHDAKDGTSDLTEKYDYSVELSELKGKNKSKSRKSCNNRKHHHQDKHYQKCPTIRGKNKIATLQTIQKAQLDNDLEQENGKPSSPKN